MEKDFKAYQMRVYRNGKISETGGPYKTRSSAMKDAKELANQLRLESPHSGFRATVAKVTYSGKVRKPRR